MLPTTLVALVTFVLDLSTASPVYNMQPAFITTNIGSTNGRNIRNLPCVSRKNTGLTGVCMFAIDCLKANGTHLGTCIDRFYFGSCCHIEPIKDHSIETNIILDTREPPERVHNTTQKVASTSTSTVASTSVSASTAQIVNKLSQSSTTTTAPSSSTTTTTTTTTTTPPPKLQTFQVVNSASTTTQTLTSLPSTTTKPVPAITAPSELEKPVQPSSSTNSPSTTIKPASTTKTSTPSTTTPSTPKPASTMKLTTPTPSSTTKLTTSTPSSTTKLSTSTPSSTTKLTTSTPSSTKKPSASRPSSRPTKPSQKPVKISSTKRPAGTTTKKPVTTTNKPPRRGTRPSSTTAKPSTSPSTKRPAASTTKKPTSSTTKAPSTTKLPTTTTAAAPSKTKSPTTTTVSTAAPPTTKPPTTTSASTAAPPTTKPPTTMSTVAVTSEESPLKKNITQILESGVANPAVNEVLVESSSVAIGSTAMESTTIGPHEVSSEALNASTSTSAPTSPEGSTDFPPGLVTWIVEDTKNHTVEVNDTLGVAGNATEEWKPITTPDGWVLLPSVTSTTSAPSTSQTNETTAATTQSSSSTTTVDSSTFTASMAPETTTLTPSTATMESLTTEITPKPVNMSDYTDVCGRRMWPEARIVGGEKSAFGRWPWQISLRQWRTSTYLHKCGAALLNENWAITAAHCVDNVPPSDLLLRLGEHDLSTESEPYLHEERRVQIVASHPQFDPRTFEYDLALLRFYEPVQFQPNIIPVCVPKSDENFVGRTAYVTGWGRLYEDGPLPSILQEVSVPVINNSVCESMYRNAGYIEHIPHIFICAGWRKGGFDSCEGDSGGPMVIQREDRRFLLAGVISWGIGCAEPNQPGVYTRISEFRDWINQILQF